MGAFLDKPKVEKQNEDGKGNELEYAVSSMQGWRVDMEDSHTAKSVLNQLPKWSFFAVFDGHAGCKVAEHSSQHLLEEIMSQEYIKELTDGKEGKSQEKANLVERAIKDAFLNLDRKMRKLCDTSDSFDRSGSTSVCVLISPSRYYFINCGDSRALLCRKGQVHFATADHKPCNPKERERIQKAGGSVMIQRVNGSLAVSRALGDYEYKNVNDKGPTEQLVSPEPDITAVDRNYKDDQFLILACDGIFDVSANEELSSYVLSRLLVTDNLTTICNDVVDLSLSKGSRDNMTLILLALPSVPKPSEKAQQEEENLDIKLKSMMKEIVEQGRKSQPPNMDFSFALQSLINKHGEIGGLPPGAGIHAKRRYLEGVFEELWNDSSNGDGNNVTRANGDENNTMPVEAEPQP